MQQLGEGVMAHEFSSPEAGICQNSAVHCGLMCFIHLPSPFSHRSTPLMRVYASKRVYM